MKCRLCGKAAYEINGWLERVNPKCKGIEAIMECRPSCNCSITNEDAIIGAITGKFKGLNYLKNTDNT